MFIEKDSTVVKIHGEFQRNLKHFINNKNGFNVISSPREKEQLT